MAMAWTPQIQADAFKNAAKPQVVVGSVAAGVSAVAVVAYSWAGADQVEVLALLVVFGLAAVLVGALLGFLFGIPRSQVVREGQTVSFEESSITPHTSLPNTNLEQVSDWLTKILLGVGLTQIQNIVPAAQDLFTSMASALGDRESATAFVGAHVIFSLVVGFIGGWLATRTLVSRLLAHTDGREISRDRVSGEHDPEPPRWSHDPSTH